MALETQDITIDFGQGLEQKSDSKRIPIGSLTVANNIMFTKDKQVRRRYGLSAFANVNLGAGEGDPDTGMLLTAATSPDVLQSRRYTKYGSNYEIRSADGNQQTSADSKNATVRLTQLAAGEYTSAAAGQQVSVSNGTYICTFLSSPAGVFFSLRTLDGRSTLNNTQISGLSAGVLRAFSTTTTAYVVTANSASSLAVAGISYTGGAGLAATTIATNVEIDSRSLNGFDVIPGDGAKLNTHFWVTYQTLASTTLNVREIPIATPGAPTYTETVALPSANDSTICFARNDYTLTTTSTLYVFVAQRNQTTIRWARCASSGAGVLTEGLWLTHGFSAALFNTPFGLAATHDGTTFNVLISGIYSAAQPFINPDTRVVLAVGTSSTGAIEGYSSHVLASTIIKHTDGKLYWIARNEGYVVLMCADDTLRPYAKATLFLEEQSLYSLVNVNNPYDTTPTWFQVGTTLYCSIYKQTRPVNLTFSTLELGSFVPVLVALTFGQPTRNKTNIGDRAFFAGLSVQDNLTLSGFLDPLKVASYTTYVTSDTITSRTFYLSQRYVVNGVTYRGPLSKPHTFTSGSGVIFTVFGTHDPEQQGCYVDLFATENNGTIYYLLNTTQMNTAGVATTITTQQLNTAATQLYAQGGALENIPPSAPRWVQYARGRLWAPSPENETDLFHSSQPISGEDVRWHPDLVVKVPAEGGAITAVIEHNQRILVFKENAVYAVSGDGPSITGQGGSFQVDQLSTSYGCEGPTSAVLIPDGVLFKTASNGFWLVTNRYEFEYAGRGVDDYKTTPIGYTVHVPTQNQVRFYLDIVSAQTTFFLVYDYAHKTWALYSYQLTGSFEKIVDMCVSGDGSLYFLTDAATPRVLSESAASYLDVALVSGAAYEAKMTTGWINLADVDGFQRIRYIDLQGSAAAAGSLVMKMTVSFDYNDTVAETHLFTLTGATDALLRLINRTYLTRQKCRAIKLSIAPNVADSSTFAETTFTSLTFRVGIKKKAAPADESSRS